ncbi:hypothetical protein NUSPORA_00429 [Nucleospora cyclopteri]
MSQKPIKNFKIKERLSKYKRGSKRMNTKKMITKQINKSIIEKYKKDLTEGRK